MRDRSISRVNLALRRILTKGCSTTELQQRRGYRHVESLDPSRCKQPTRTRAGLDVRAAQTMLHVMTSKQTPSRQTATRRPAPGKLAARLEREAAALRANLRKRKEQARAREAPKQD
jgi:hypothetical protein